MISFFKELFGYNHYMNQQQVQLFLSSNTKASDKATKLFSHTLNAHHVWNSRISVLPSSVTVWQIHDIAAYKNMDLANYEHSLKILDTVDLEKNISYVNSSGQAFDNTVRDILFHVINHSTYHRGQIATEFKNNGATPIISDYIFYKR